MALVAIAQRHYAPPQRYRRSIDGKIADGVRGSILDALLLRSSRENRLGATGFEAYRIGAQGAGGNGVRESVDTGAVRAAGGFRWRFPLHSPAWLTTSLPKFL